MLQLTPKQAKSLLKAQALIGAIAAACVAPFGTHLALSVGLGALVCLLANALFGWLVFRDYDAGQSGEIVARFYGAEMVKLVLVIGAFAAAWTLVDSLSVPALLGGYLATSLLPPMLTSTRPSRKT